MIRTVSLMKRYQNFTAVDGLNLEVKPGEVYGFLGPNGAGKTTTIRMLTGILEPDSGDIEIFGKSYKKNRNYILNHMGYIPDRPFLYGKLSAMELIRFMGSLRKMDRNFVKKRGLALLEQFNLGEFAYQLVERYSHGMKQKLVLATALLHDPDLLIVDEPMVGLDPRAARQVKELILEFAQKGKTVFMSTHTLEVAAKLCDRIGIIHKAKLVASETLASLTEKLEAPSGDLEAVFLAMTQDQEAAMEAIPQ